MKYKRKSAWAVVLTLVLTLLLMGCAATLGAENRSDSSVTSENNALRISLAQNTNVSSSDVAAPFQSISGELLKTCSFPVALPTCFPSPSEGNEWIISPEVNPENFSIEIDQQSVGYTGQTHSLADWYGIMSGNIGKPAEQLLKKQFESGNIKVKKISLPDGIKGKEYIDDSNVIGGTAITWDAGQWSFFVNAYPEGSDFSTMNYANQIINTIKDSGQDLPGSQGRFYFIYNGNMPMTKIYWEVESGIWYELDMREPNDTIKILQSMRIVNS